MVLSTVLDDHHLIADSLVLRAVGGVELEFDTVLLLAVNVDLLDILCLINKAAAKLFT